MYNSHTWLLLQARLLLLPYCFCHMFSNAPFTIAAAIQHTHHFVAQNASSALRVELPEPLDCRLLVGKEAAAACSAGGGGGQVLGVGLTPN
eukprot:363518-Chlamydomonas_euryale.AAC.4